VIADEVDGRDELAETLQRVVLALERHEDGVGRRQRIDGQQTQGWGAVHEDVVVGLRDGRQDPGETPFPPGERRKLHFGPGEGDRGSHEIEARDLGGRGEPVEGHVVHERVVDRPSIGCARGSKATRRVALGVEVDHEDARTVGGEVCGDVDDGGSLPDAALLVGAGNRLAHLPTRLSGDHDREVYHRGPHPILLAASESPARPRRASCRPSLESPAAPTDETPRRASVWPLPLTRHFARTSPYRDGSPRAPPLCPRPVSATARPVSRETGP
jgi:hypothetical protein